MKSKISKKIVEGVLKNILDPEMGFSIFDLGLIYKIGIKEKKKSVVILMTLTSPVCPLQEYFKGIITKKIQAECTGWRCIVEITFNPLWNPNLISKGVKEQLLILGIPLVVR